MNPNGLDDPISEDLQDSIYVRERIERGRREAEQERLIDQEEIESRMKQWLSGSRAATPIR